MKRYPDNITNKLKQVLRDDYDAILKSNAAKSPYILINEDGTRQGEDSKTKYINVFKIFGLIF